MKLYCEICGMFLGTIEKGSRRKGSVCLCSVCWQKAKTAHEVAEDCQRETPQFINDLLKNFHGTHKP